jgi:hypothetical protein
MSENIIWVYNGWALFITCLGLLYSVADIYARKNRSFVLRSLFPFFALSSVALLAFLAHWLTAVLYLPLYAVLSIPLVLALNVIEALVGYRAWDEVL